MVTTRSNPLSRDEILSAALALIDSEGADALSMRRLARELHVEAMSLYHHVPNKQALLDGVVELSLTSPAPARPPEGDWRATVMEAVAGFRRALTAHPNVLPLMVGHPPTSDEASRTYVEAPLRFLLANGFAERDAAELFESLFALAFGHAMLTTNYRAVEVDGVPVFRFTEASFGRAVQVLLDGYATDR